jgi:hypothetical protein
MRIRTIKPEFWTHPVMSRQSDAAKLLAIGLLNYADDEGFFYADARMVRAALRPLDEDSTNTRRALEQLFGIGFLSVREHPSHGPIGHILSFLEHQRIDRANPSVIRGLFTACAAQDAIKEEVNSFDEGSTNDRGSIVANVALEGKGKEGKGRDIGAGRKPAPKASKIASLSKPTDADEAVAYFVAQGSTDEQGRTFFDHFEANGWRQGGKTVMKDWQAAARNWIRRSAPAVRGAAAGLGGGAPNGKNNFGAAGRGGAEEATKLPIVGIDVGADEVAALEAGKGGAS